MTRRRKWDKFLVKTEIHELHNKLRRRPVKRDNSNLYRLSRKFFGSWNNAMESAGYKVKRFQFIDSISMCPNLFYFAGLIITDGHLQMTKKRRKMYKVLVFTSYEKEKNMIYNLSKKLFNYSPLIRKKKYGWNVRINYEIQIASKKLVEFLNEKFQIPTGAKSKYVKVPDLLFTTSTKNISSFLRGVIDGDGSISINATSIKICSSSIIFLEGLKKLLLILGIKSGKLSKNKKIHEFYISGKDNIKKLYDSIYPADFFYPRKKESFNKLLKQSD